MFKIKNVWVCQINDNNIDPFFGDIELADGSISSLIERDYVFENVETAEDIDGAGRVVTIPNINFHEHFYSRLAKGLPSIGPSTNFQEILENLWWKLDKLLDEDMLKASVHMGAIESIRNGVTYVFDHHSSPTFTKGSLRTIGDVMSQYSLRGVLCFETSDRNGKSISEDSINEHVNTFSDFDNSDFQVLLGLHASFTLNDSTLNLAHKLLKEHHLGIHIHLCEDKSDAEITLEKTNYTPIERLNNFGLLNDRSILAHGIHLTATDYKIISESGSAIAYNLHSNLNNSVGIPDFTSVPKSIPILLGTDGMHANVASSLKQYFLLMRNAGLSFEEVFGRVSSNYFKQLSFIKQYFHDFPSLHINDRADLIIWDYVPPTPFTKENFWGHYIYGILESPVQHVIQKGNFLMKDFQINFDVNEKRKTINTQGNRLFQKFSEAVE